VNLQHAEIKKPATKVPSAVDEGPLKRNPRRIDEVRSAPRDVMAAHIGKG
jgi:hypothetical protein